MIDDREKNLPKWAQELLISLRIENREKDRQLAIARKDARADGATGLVTADYLTNDGFPLPDRAAVRFRLPNGNVYVTLREGGTREGGKFLSLSTKGPMFVLPRAGNSIYVKIGDL